MNSVVRYSIEQVGTRANQSDSELPAQATGDRVAADAKVAFGAGDGYKRAGKAAEREGRQRDRRGRRVSHVAEQFDGG